VLKNFLILFILIQGILADSSTVVPDSLEQDSLIPANQSNLKSQLDSASTLLKKMGKIIEKGVNSLTNKQSDKKTKTKEYLEGEIRREFYKLTAKFEPVPIIKAQDLFEIYKDSTSILIDVRKTEEIEVSTIPGAYSTVEFAKKFTNPQMLQGKTIIGYCTIGYRSCEYLLKLKKLDLKVKNLEGGILSWTHIDGPLVRKGSNGLFSETREVHTYDEEWDFTPSGYSGKW